MNSARESCEHAFNSMVGHVVVSVTYMGAWSSSPFEPGAYVEWAELTTKEDVVFRITTEAEFGDYGLVVLQGPVDRYEGLLVADVTRAVPWAHAVGKPIASVEVLWRRLSYAGAAAQGESPEYPRDAVIRLVDGSALVVCAGSGGEDGSWILGADSVGAFTEAQARRFGILAPDE